MRNLLVVFLLLSILSCTNTEKKKSIKFKHESKGEIAEEIKFIGDSIYMNGRLEGCEYEVFKTFYVDLNNDKVKDTIILEVMPNCGDPGDFHCVNILLSNGKKLSFSGNFVNTDYIAKFIPTFNESNIFKSKFITIKRASNNNLLLLFKGYPYASKPGFLTIVNIVDNDAPFLLLNKPAEIYAFHDYNCDGINDIATISCLKQFYEKGKTDIDVYLLDGGFKRSMAYSFKAKK